MECDCGARPEEIAAGIHFPGCTAHDGETDDASDHYRL